MATTTQASTGPEAMERPLFDIEGGQLRLIPLGGVGEFGMNMMCYEAGGERLLVDCGAMFPDDEMLGVDLVIPDVQYLLDEPERLKGIVLTHGHEDHIGALPYILTQIQAPVYGTALTLAYLREKLEEHRLLDKVELNEINFRELVPIGAHLQIQALHVTHSIPDAAALAIHTPAGVVIHSGDYKIDYSPPDGHAFDLYAFSRLGEEGVLALVGDSTNANVPGSTQTEHWVEQNLDPVFASSEQAIFCATFSTSIHRLRVLMDLAMRYGRKICIMGRSLERTFRVATELGYLSMPRDAFCPPHALYSIAPSERLIIATGSQGEPMSAMARLARGEHKHVEIEEGDTVILSARAIPNNIRAISHMLNHLCRRGARIYDSASASVHASGHAYREEIKALLSLTRPRFLIPVHGELRQLLAHRDVALTTGFDPDAIFVIEDGDVIEFSQENGDLANATAQLVGRIEIGRTHVDGKTVGETGEVVLRDRRHLSEDGMLIAILNVDQKTKKLLSEPEIVTRGFVYVDESEDLMEELRDLVRETFEACGPDAREDPEVLHAEVRRSLRKFIRKTYDRFPLILPVIQEL